MCVCADVRFSRELPLTSLIVTIAGKVWVVIRRQRDLEVDAESD